jgi:ferritin-like metal-binding protein YciE
MPDLNERDTKLVQYLNEAYGKEKELEAALEAHIGMTDRAPYKKRLQAHLRETKGHARKVEQRIKQLGSSPQATQTVVGKATAALKGPVHALRGTGSEERELKNAKTEYSEEAEEIATYNAIEAFADSVGDRDTAKMAREIRRDEERMAKYLAGLIPQLSKAVVRAEVPAAQRNGGKRRRSRRSRSGSSGRSRSGARRTAASSRRSSSTSRSSSGSRSRSGSRSTSRSSSSSRRGRARSGGRS